MNLRTIIEVSRQIAWDDNCSLEIKFSRVDPYFCDTKLVFSKQLQVPIKPHDLLADHREICSLTAVSVQPR